MAGTTFTSGAISSIPQIGSTVTFTVLDNSAFPALSYLVVTDTNHAFIGRVISGSGMTSLTVAVEEILLGSQGDTVSTSAIVAFPSFNGTIVSAKDFGARGDGVTSDDSSINVALAAAGAFGPTSGATVVLPPGLYMLAGPVSGFSAGVSLVGAGMGATILRAQNASGFSTAALVGSSSSAGVRVADLTIDGNNTTQNFTTSGAGQLLAVGSEWVVERVKFINGNSFKCVVPSGATNIKIRDCVFEANTSGVGGATGVEHIGGGGATDVLIEGNYYGFADTSGNAQLGNFIDLHQGKGVVIRDNYVEVSALGNILLEGVTESVIESNVTHNSIGVNSNAADGALTVTFPRNVLIVNNVVDNTFRPAQANAGISLLYDDSATVAASGRIAGGGNTIRGNFLYNVPYMGILVDSQVTNTPLTGIGHQIPGSAIAYDTVSDNHVVNCNTSQTNTKAMNQTTYDCAGIVIGGSAFGAVVQDNTIEDNFGEGNAISGAAFTWPSGAVLPFGLAFTSMITGRYVSNVNVSGNKVRRVVGYAHGTLTVGGSATSGETLSVFIASPGLPVVTGTYLTTASDQAAGLTQIANNLAATINRTTAVFVGQNGTAYPFLQPCWVSGAVITLEALVVGTAGSGITTQTSHTAGSVTVSPSGITNLAGGLDRLNNGFYRVQRQADFNVTCIFSDNYLNDLPWPPTTITSVDPPLSGFAYTNLDQVVENVYVSGGTGLTILKGGLVVTSPVTLRPGEQIVLNYTGSPTLKTDQLS
jgi:hypothetical protein